MKKSTITYRRGRGKRSTYFLKEKNRRAYQYPAWVTDPRNPEHRMPDAMAKELQDNLLNTFPRLAAVPVEKRQPHWLWHWRPRNAA